jgi:hypothetical protein
MLKRTRLVLFRTNLKVFSSCLTATLLILANCKPPGEKVELPPRHKYRDTIATHIAPAETAKENGPMRFRNVIVYGGAERDETRLALENFSPFTQIVSLARKSIVTKDSVEMMRLSSAITFKDSLVFLPSEMVAYQAILAYKKLMASGPRLQGNCPSLLQLNRTTNDRDSSFALLPAVNESKFLAHGNFFFFGGAPFIHQFRKDDNTVYTDPRGNPEVRFESFTTENGNYFLNSFYHFRNEAANITFGPPLESYYDGDGMGPWEVNGIGSLTHNFVNRIPVFFLTEDGLVSAQLISVTLKVVPVSIGCASGQPRLEFACSRDIGENDILAVYISYSSPPPTSCVVVRQDNFVWTADINEDGIPDIASVSDFYEGIDSDDIVEVLWFVNINGTWKIIDWDQLPECT